MSTSSCAATARTKSCSGYCEDRDANENMEGMKYEPHRAASPVASPHGNVSGMWYSLVKLPICRYYFRTRKMRDDTAHDMQISSRQSFADPEKASHLGWRELHFARFVPFSQSSAVTIG